MNNTLTKKSRTPHSNNNQQPKNKITKTPSNWAPISPAKAKRSRKKDWVVPKKRKSNRRSLQPTFKLQKKTIWMSTQTSKQRKKIILIFNQLPAM